MGYVYNSEGSEVRQAQSFFPVICQIFWQTRWQTNQSIKTFSNNSVAQVRAKNYETVGACLIIATASLSPWASLMTWWECDWWLQKPADAWLQRSAGRNAMLRVRLCKNSNNNRLYHLKPPLLEFLYGWRNGLQSEQRAEPSRQVCDSPDWQSQCCRPEVPVSAAFAAAAGWCEYLTSVETPASKRTEKKKPRVRDNHRQDELNT